jgi:ABC-type Fe3+/spermidine/putrescine transport system ATPase subunit
MLELRHISQNYGDRALLQDVNLTVAAGEIVALLGPSGSGKSTLLAIVAGLQQPLDGSVWFDGQNITQRPPEQRRFALMFQDFALFPHLNVLDNVALACLSSGWTNPRLEPKPWTCWRCLA